MIIQHINVTYQLNFPKHSHIMPMFHVSCLKHANSGPLPAVHFQVLLLDPSQSITNPPTSFIFSWTPRDKMENLSIWWNTGLTLGVMLFLGQPQGPLLGFSPRHPESTHAKNSILTSWETQPLFLGLPMKRALIEVPFKSIAMHLIGSLEQTAQGHLFLLILVD